MSIWTSDIENVIADIGNQSADYYEYHAKISLYSSQVYQGLMISLLVVSPISSTLTALGLATESVHASYYLNVIGTIIGFGSTVLASVLKFGKYDEMSNAHRLASARFLSLKNNVLRQLALPRTERQDVTNYLKWLTTSFDDLIQSAPLIPMKDSSAIVPLRSIEVNSEKESPPRSTHVFSAQQDLNKFSDGLMKYQINRSMESLRKLDSVVIEEI